MGVGSDTDVPVAVRHFFNFNEEVGFHMRRASLLSVSKNDECKYNQRQEDDDPDAESAIFR